MPLLQDDHSTKDDWFKAECARTYSHAGDNEWNSRHVALADWFNVWNSKDAPEADSSRDLGPILYDQCTHGGHIELLARSLEPGMTVEKFQDLGGGVQSGGPVPHLTFEAIVESDNHGTVLRHRAEQYRMEFEAL